MKKVIILGGGIAGMSAAHELIEKGFEVTIFERQLKLPGGKARSFPLEEYVSNHREPLPGEHGFRFFPGFYRNIIDTMRRIPFHNKETGQNNKNGVYDNLVECPSIMLARLGQAPITTPSHFPRSPKDVQIILHNLLNIDTGLEPGEGKVIATKIWQLMTSCRQRRETEYEIKSWWDFAQANEYSESYKTLFVTGLTRSLIAAQAETANTRTNGNILLQILFNFSNPSVIADRILCGPTNEMWLFPWLSYLKDKGVKYNFDSEVVELVCDKEKITGVFVSQHKSEKKLFTADFYLCALPVERVAKIINKPELFTLDPSLRNIITLSSDVAWMNGIQYYLREDAKINEGHIILVDTPWALTAISQAQFWQDIDVSKYGKGDVKGIISVDISNWENCGELIKKPASKCTEIEVIIEVWFQMKTRLTVNGQPVLKDDDYVIANVDESIIFKQDFLAFSNILGKFNIDKQAKYGSNVVNENEEPLLVNKKDTWRLRNDAKTRIPNLFLASDYVRSSTNLATMEGANEAARKAVNHILAVSNVKRGQCKVWELEEPYWLLYYKWLDYKRFKKGQDWKLHESWFAGIISPLLIILGKKKTY